MDRSSITRSEVDKLNCEVKIDRSRLTVFHKLLSRRRIVVECSSEYQSYGSSSKFSIEQYDKCTRGQLANLRYNNCHWNRSLKYHLILGADIQNRILIGAARGRPCCFYIQNTIFGFAYFGEGVKNI